MPAPPISIQPVCLQTRQPLPPQNGAVDREIDARLDEREEVAAEADLRSLAEELPRHLGQRALQVGHRDVVVDRQSLD